MGQLYLLRYGELGLKGKNRSFFEKTLMRNIRGALAGLPFRIEHLRGRLLVEAEGREKQVLSRLQTVFGLTSISPVIKTNPEMETILSAAGRALKPVYKPGITFKVETRRTDKRFPLESPEISRQAGSYLLKNFPDLKVDVHKPEIIIGIEIREDAGYIYSGSYPAPGGLPVGTTGKGLLMLSGGIDSPVAGRLACKRGVRVEALHFHSFPFTGDRAKQKVIDLCQILARYGNGITLHVAPFTEIQTEIRKNCPEKFQITLMRRMMFRIADLLAEQRRAGAIFTGENLGQVASQTMESIAVISRVAKRPIFRPLIGMDKQEIVTLAKAMGSYEISILPYEDCCTVFVPRHPVTRPSLAEVEAAEKHLDIEVLLKNCFQGIERETIKPELNE